MMKILTSAALAAVLSMSTSGVVAAQDLGSKFARDKNVSVRQRPRPDYEAIGIKTGGFTVYPRLTLSAESNDNIYATATGKEDDIIWRVRPEIAARSNWSRHALGAFASASINRYGDFGSEDTEEYTVGANGRLDVERGSNISGLVQYQKLTEPRTAPTSPQSSNAPVQYNLVTSNLVGIKEFNRLRLTVRLDDKDYNFEDTNIDQDFRDRNEFFYGGKAEYAVSPDTALYFSVVGNTKSYDLATSGRDSDGFVTTVGANFDISGAVRGDVEIGYMKQSYDNQVLYHNIDGLNARGKLEWFPTQLTTLTFNGSRQIEESVATGSGGYISNNLSAGIDHELLRNVLLSAQTSFGKDKYVGVDRNDKRTGATLGGTYLLNRNVGLFLTYNYLKQKSSGAQSGADFTDNKLTASVALQF